MGVAVEVDYYGLRGLGTIYLPSVTLQSGAVYALEGFLQRGSGGPFLAPSKAISTAMGTLCLPSVTLSVSPRSLCPCKVWVVRCGCVGVRVVVCILSMYIYIYM